MKNSKIIKFQWALLERGEDDNYYVSLLDLGECTGIAQFIPAIFLSEDDAIRCLGSATKTFPNKSYKISKVTIKPHSVELL